VVRSTANLVPRSTAGCCHAVNLTAWFQMPINPERFVTFSHQPICCFLRIWAIQMALLLLLLLLSCCMIMSVGHFPLADVPPDISPPGNFLFIPSTFPPAVKSEIWKLTLTRTPDPNRYIYQFMYALAVDRFILLKLFKSFSRFDYIPSDQLAKRVVKFESKVNTV